MHVVKDNFMTDGHFFFAALVGVPIDMVGGTSIGALVGALYCEDCDAEEVYKRAESFAKRMSSYWDKILDLTYPSMSMFTGEYTRIYKNILEYTKLY